jgi:hypothetical protein
MAARTTDADRSKAASPRKALPPGSADPALALSAPPGKSPRATGGGATDDAHRHRQAAQHAIHTNTTHLDLRLGSAHAHLELPPVDKLAFYAGLVGAAAFGVIEWPIAVIAGVGHLLSDDRRNRTLRALGEALDAV